MAPGSRSHQSHSREGGTEKESEGDYYVVLEVDCLASQSAIRESYRRLALQWHPDKNRGSAEKVERATSRFQELGRAWEVLGDVVRRREYDGRRLRTGRGFNTERWWEGSKRGRDEYDESEWYGKSEEDEDLGERARRRRRDVDREASERWMRESDSTSSSVSGEEQQQLWVAEEAARKARAAIWKAGAKRKYQIRLQGWKNFREERRNRIEELRRSLKRYEANLEAQDKETEEDVETAFRAAIAKSREDGREIRDPDAIIAKLLDARENYSGRLKRSVEQHRRELEKHLRELERDGRRYEKEEAKARAIQIREAIEILGPRNLNPPLFSVLNRRGLAINHWKALSRIKNADKYPSLWDSSEGPWHVSGDWERIAGEHTCGRCEARAFHFIASCGPARCSGCGMVVCNDCYRDLRILQEYGAWLVSEEGEMTDSLFCLDADLSASCG